MGRKLHFKLGSFYRVDDRTGFPQRAERTRQEWTNNIVDGARWEPRQPQDLVRGVKDDQSVPKPRPLAPNVFVGPQMEALSASVAVGAKILPMQTTVGFSNGDSVGVMMDNGVVFHSTITASPTAGSITIAQGLPSTAASGNLVTDYEAPL